MKIDEAVNIINSTNTARASLGKENIYFYENLVVPAIDAMKEEIKDDDND